MNINAIKSKLHMDHHHRMEQFGVIFVIFVVVLSLIMAQAIRINVKNSKYQITSASIVGSTSIPWSKTGDNMVINGVYSNADNTKVMIWLKVDGMSHLSTDPGEYKLFISPYQGMEIKHPLSGSLYMFGDTGNIAIVLYDSMKFENVVMEITMRGTAIVEDPDFENPYSDPSFSTNNQCCFNINPAGTDATVVDFLDEDILNARDMYFAGSLSAELESVKEGLYDSLDELKDDLAVYNQCARVLEDSQFVIPTAPAAIISDFISVNPVDAAGSPVVFSDNMLDLDDAIIKSSHDTVATSSNTNTDISNSTTNNTETSDAYYYVSDFVYPGGLNVAINDVQSIEEMYNSLKPAGSTFYEWKAAQKEIADKYADSIKSPDVDDDSWQQDSKIYSFGTVPKYDEAINNYNDAVVKLMDDKKEYQTSKIYDIFECVSQLDSIADRVTINSDSGFITKWKHYN